MKPFLRLLVLFAALPLLAEKTLPLDVPPYICMGRILNANHLNIAALDETAVIRVYKYDGTLLARSPVEVIPGTPYTYRLIIPMTEPATATTAAPGEALDVRVFYGGKTYLTEGVIPSAQTASYNVHNVTLFLDEDNNAVSDEYEEIVEQMLSALGREEAAAGYNATADYDGDGASNYEEYVAGTNPLDDADHFSITVMQCLSAEQNKVLLKFITSRAKTYQLYTSDSLDVPREQWTLQAFREDEKGTTTTAYHTGETFPDPLEKAIYVPEDDASSADADATPASPSRFFYINVQ